MKKRTPHPLDHAAPRRKTPSGTARSVVAGPVAGSKEGAGGLQEQIAALEAEVALYREALRNAREDMQAFAYSVSHDLKAPLRAIEGFSKILLEDYGKELSPDAERFLNHIIVNTETLGGQIEDLLRYYRAGKNEPAHQIVDLDAVCREIIFTLPPADSTRVIIQGKLPSVSGDPVQLREILAQLISNGLKFSKDAPNPKVEIFYTTEKGAVRVSVRDHGVGFDTKHASKLFQVFQRLHTGNEFPGNGIGLAIVKRLIVAHGGCVDAEAAPQQGATFTITLPGEPVAAAA
jgi:signal transduction histidine kinase